MKYFHRIIAVMISSAILICVASPCMAGESADIGSIFKDKMFSENKYLSELNTTDQNSDILYSTILDGINAMYTEKFSYPFSKSAQNGAYSANWQVMLSGWVTYNSITHAISSATNPTLSIISTESDLDLVINNISTNRTIHSTSVTFSCTYSVYGYDSNVIQYSFGTYTCSFVATPSS